MRTADWTELDPDATYYGWHQPRTGYVSSCVSRLRVARQLAIDDEGPAESLVAYLNGEHVRVPDGDPPTKPSLAELQRASDEAELAWYEANTVRTLDALRVTRAALLRARLAEGS